LLENDGNPIHFNPDSEDEEEPMDVTPGAPTVVIPDHVIEYLTQKPDTSGAA